MVQNLLIKAFALTKSLGLLNWWPTKKLFVACYSVYKRFLEDDLAKIAKLRPELFRGGDVVDIGANIGYTAMLLAKYKDLDRKLIAFEPENWNFEILSSRFSRMSDVSIVQKAVGESSRTAYLVVNDAHHADHRIGSSANNGSPIELVSIDSFLKANQISFVKIDVQGYELKVLQGMRETIIRNPALSVLAEIVIYDPSDVMKIESAYQTKEIFSFFFEKGFKAYVLVQNQLVQIRTVADFCKVVERNYADVLFTRR